MTCTGIFSNSFVNFKSVKKVIYILTKYSSYDLSLTERTGRVKIDIRGKTKEEHTKEKPKILKDRGIINEYHLQYLNHKNSTQTVIQLNIRCSQMEVSTERFSTLYRVISPWKILSMGNFY